MGGKGHRLQWSMQETKVGVTTLRSRGGRSEGGIKGIRDHFMPSSGKAKVAKIQDLGASDTLK